MRRKIAAVTAGALILAGLLAATAEGNGNPWEGLQATVDALVANDAEQDARIAALERRANQLERRAHRLAVQIEKTRARSDKFDRKLARCGMLDTQHYTETFRGVRGPSGAKRTKAAWFCFEGVHFQMGPWGIR